MGERTEPHKNEGLISGEPHSNPLEQTILNPWTWQVMKLDSFSNYGALRDPTRRWGSWYQPFLAFQMGSPSWWECLGPKCGRFGEVETKIPPIDWYRNSWKVPRCFPELVLSPKSPGLLAKNHLLLKRKLVTYPPLKTEKSSHPVTRFRHPPPKKGESYGSLPSIHPFF